MSNDLNAILAHKDFEYPNKIYFHNDVCVYSQKKIKTNLPFKKYKSEYDDKMFGELGIWKYLYEKESNREWYTLEHYRRHIVNVYHEISVPKPILFNCTTLDQLAACHSVKLVELLKAVLSANDFALISRINYLIPYNIMHINRETLQKWLNYVEPIIQKCVDIIKIKDQKTMIEQMKVDKTFTSNELPNGQFVKDKNVDPIYQARIYGFILERLTTIFFTKALYNGSKIYYCDVELLEQGQHI